MGTLCLRKWQRLQLRATKSRYAQTIIVFGFQLNSDLKPTARRAVRQTPKRGDTKRSMDALDWPTTFIVARIWTMTESPEPSEPPSAIRPMQRLHLLQDTEEFESILAQRIGDSGVRDFAQLKEWFNGCKFCIVPNIEGQEGSLRKTWSARTCRELADDR